MSLQPHAVFSGGAARTFGRVLRTRYPGFLFGLPLARNETPVFTYHDVTAAQLGEDLEFLRDNGYGVLTLKEYLARADEPRRRLPRAVLLTFDDARVSFWNVALPLLRAYQAPAVLFVPTYWIDAPGPDGTAFMNWRQLRECLASGMVDVQSHAHRHALVPVSPRAVGFASYEALKRFDLFDWPLRMGDEGEELGRPALGTPVYRARPLLSAPERYFESPQVTRICRAFVQRVGNAFFERPAYVRQLRRLHAGLVDKYPGRWAEAQEVRRAMMQEFELSRARFCARLGYSPRVLAYPWMLGSRLSMELARQAGIGVAFGVALDFGAQRARDLPLRVYGRLKCDWLRCLPGSGRMHVLPALARKLRNLPAHHHPAH